MIGPGKYDPLCTFIREQTKAVGCALIVIDGDRGMGFSVQAPLEVQVALAGTLRFMADTIEKDIEKTFRDPAAYRGLFTKEPASEKDLAPPDPEQKYRVWYDNWDAQVVPVSIAEAVDDVESELGMCSQAMLVTRGDLDMEATLKVVDNLRLLIQSTANSKEAK